MTIDEADDERDRMSDEDWYCGATEACPRCDGEGFILICPDDLCRGSGHCIHGDGEVICPDCKGDGAVP